MVLQVNNRELFAAHRIANDFYTADWKPNTFFQIGLS